MLQMFWNYHKHSLKNKVQRIPNVLSAPEQLTYLKNALLYLFTWHQYSQQSTCLYYTLEQLVTTL